MLVLFLCTGNSCRSQMAEGFGKLYAPDGWQVASAGSRPVGYVHPKAIAVMAEKGVDIAGNSSKHLNDFPKPDVVVTLCGSAAEECPLYPGALMTEHWGLPDPAHAEGDEAAVLNAFRSVRDEVERRVKDLFARL